jgi:hypothetical protein
MSFLRAIEGKLFAGGVIDAKTRQKLTGADLDFPGAPKAQAAGAKKHYRPGNPDWVDPGDLARLAGVDWQRWTMTSAAGKRRTEVFRRDKSAQRLIAASVGA